ncbi:MAG: nucleotidyltransferase family protein, partial [Actinomycetota bacterium]
MYQDLLATTAHEMAPAASVTAAGRPAAPDYVNVTAEGTLLVRILRDYFHPTATALHRDLLPAVDWNRFRQLAAVHHVEPLVYRQLQQNSEGAPEAVLAGIQRQVRVTGFRNLVLTRELVRLTQVFAKPVLEAAIEGAKVRF